MRNLFVYYLAIIVPLVFLFFLRYSAELFTIGLIVYAFIYRTITDGIRLANKNIITKKEIWKLASPFGGYRFKYFRQLYLER